MGNIDGPVINAEDCTTPIKIIEKFKINTRPRYSTAWGVLVSIRSNF